MKTCNSCGVSKADEDFYAVTRRGALSSQCRACIVQKRREFRAKEGERINAERRARRVAKQRATPHERFARYIQRDPTGCWLWLGHITADGYGLFWLNGKNVQAHRASYWLWHGSLPADAWVLHTCDVRNCVNPSHLYLGDHTQNVRDREERNPTKAWAHRGETHVAAKFSDEQVREMFRLRAAGLLQREIAERFGTNQAYVSELLRQKNRVVSDSASEAA